MRPLAGRDSPGTSTGGGVATGRVVCRATGGATVGVTGAGASTGASLPNRRNARASTAPRAPPNAVPTPMPVAMVPSDGSFPVSALSVAPAAKPPCNAPTPARLSAILPRVPAALPTGSAPNAPCTPICVRLSGLPSYFCARSSPNAPPAAPPARVPGPGCVRLLGSRYRGTTSPALARHLMPSSCGSPLPWVASVYSTDILFRWCCF